MEIIRTPKAKEEAAKALNTILVNAKGKPTLFLSSGGSSLVLLDLIDDANLGSHLMISMLDDRYSTDPQINGYQLIQKLPFYDRAVSAGCNFINTSVRLGEKLEEYAKRCEQSILDWKESNPNGAIVATIGIGPDGHTSGILPHPEDPARFDILFNGMRIVIGYDVAGKNPHRYRMTSTFSFMKTFDQSLTYMTGEEKREALNKVLAETGNIADTPGRIIRELKNHTLITDIL